MAIARALVMNPKYLLCDECTSALDPKSTVAILGLLKNLQQKFKITIIVVTHEMDVIQNLCERMAILDKGEVSLTGNVKEIFENKPKELKELIGEDNQRISITLDIEDFVGVQKYLNETNTQYKVSGGF